MNERKSVSYSLYPVKSMKCTFIVLNPYLLAKIAVVKPEGPPELCKVDEVGELCINSGSTGICYFGLTGKTNNTFKVSIF